MYFHVSFTLVFYTARLLFFIWNMPLDFVPLNGKVHPSRLDGRAPFMTAFQFFFLLPLLLRFLPAVSKAAGLPSLESMHFPSVLSPLSPVHVLSFLLFFFARLHHRFESLRTLHLNAPFLDTIPFPPQSFSSPLFDQKIPAQYRTIVHLLEVPQSRQLDCPPFFPVPFSCEQQPRRGRRPESLPAGPQGLATSFPLPYPGHLPS